MNKKTTWIYLVLILLVLAGIFLILGMSNVSDLINKKETDQVMCTMEAKLCPDGSYVGRNGPKCEFSPCSTEDVVGNNSAKINQRILNNNVYITPLKLVSDSRCPKDVQCIWAGTVTIRAKLEKEGGVQETELEMGRSITFAGQRVSLESVLPEKTSTEIKQMDYVFMFRVI